MNMNEDQITERKSFFPCGNQAIKYVQSNKNHDKPFARSAKGILFWKE